MLCRQGPDFQVFRAVRNPHSESLYLVRVLSERDPIRFVTLIEGCCIEKYAKAVCPCVADDEEELTYYEIELETS
jgi:tRNA-intron endonuclease